MLEHWHMTNGNQKCPSRLPSNASRWPAVALVLLCLAACCAPQTEHKSKEAQSNTATPTKMDSQVKYHPTTDIQIYTSAPEPVHIQAEVVFKAEDLARGLMFREELADGKGMLFVFNNDTDRSFWMENTLIPLDMIYIDKGYSIVGIVRDADPLTQDSRKVGVLSRYVLEVPGGYCQRAGIHRGDRVRFSLKGIVPESN